MTYLPESNDIELDFFGVLNNQTTFISRQPYHLWSAAHTAIPGVASGTFAAGTPSAVITPTPNLATVNTASPLSLTTVPLNYTPSTSKPVGLSRLFTAGAGLSGTYSAKFNKADASPLNWSFSSSEPSDEVTITTNNTMQVRVNQQIPAKRFITAQAANENGTISKVFEYPGKGGRSQIFAFPRGSDSATNDSYTTNRTSPIMFNGEMYIWLATGSTGSSLFKVTAANTLVKVANVTGNESNDSLGNSLGFSDNSAKVFDGKLYFSGLVGPGPLRLFSIDSSGNLVNLVFYGTSVNFIAHVVMNVTEDGNYLIIFARLSTNLYKILRLGLGSSTFEEISSIATASGLQVTNAKNYLNETYFAFTDSTFSNKLVAYSHQTNTIRVVSNISGSLTSSDSIDQSRLFVCSGKFVFGTNAAGTGKLYRIENTEIQSIGDTNYLASLPCVCTANYCYFGNNVQIGISGGVTTLAPRLSRINPSTLDAKIFPFLADGANSFSFDGKSDSYSNDVLVLRSYMPQEITGINSAGLRVITIDQNGVIRFLYNSQSSGDESLNYLGAKGDFLYLVINSEHMRYNTVKHELERTVGISRSPFTASSRPSIQTGSVGASQYAGFFNGNVYVMANVTAFTVGDNFNNSDAFRHRLVGFPE